MRRMIPAVLLLSAVLFGCRVKELAEKAKIAKDFEKRGTIDLMKDVSKDKYDPPKDGKLTDAQVQMYLKVRQHEKDIAKVAKDQMDQHSKAADQAKHSLSGVFESRRRILHRRHPRRKGPRLQHAGISLGQRPDHGGERHGIR